MKKIKVGIIGCGAIGSYLAKVIDREFSSQASLDFICDQIPEKAVRIWDALGRRVLVATLPILIERSEFVIEAASAGISAEVARESLKRNKDVLIMSVGGLLPLFHPEEWITTRGRLWIPSGAIAGVDALLAAKEAGLKSVKLVTRKPPAGFLEAPYFKKKKFPALKGRKEYCLFKGNAAEAVRSFPQNINVAALLSLAGLGPKKTQVEIWTSRKYRANQHEVTIVSACGEIRTMTQNVPFPENPKTSALAAYSAAALLRKIFSSIRMGT